jgi:hypothetical protein
VRAGRRVSVPRGARWHRRSSRTAMSCAGSRSSSSTGKAVCGAPRGADVELQ